MLLMNVHNTQRFCDTINRCSGPIEMILANGRREDLRSNRALQYLLTDVYPSDRPMSITVNAADSADVGQLVSFMLSDKLA